MGCASHQIIQRISMAKDFMGQGWKYPVRADIDGKITVSKYEEDIQEAIRIILGTAKGERLMRPDFGCVLNEYVFSSMNTANLRLIEYSVREALIQWEPRIEVLDVQTDTQYANEGKLMINIEYEVRATNTMLNFVYPFYLKEG
jgi:phage baseplate assembly protein W